MSQSAAHSSTVIAGDGTSLAVEFDYEASAGKLSVRYRLRNIGAAPLMVFDRVDRHVAMTQRRSPGAIAVPLMQQAGGDITLSHRAMPMVKPTRTVPAAPMAARLEPGAELRGAFVSDLLTMTPPKRLRWCLGVAPFDEKLFSMAQTVDGVSVWRAPLTIADRQRMLCTPWFDAGAGRFEK